MAMEYGYFDSEITGTDSEGMPIFDRAMGSELLSIFYGKLISNGVLARPADCFQVVAKEGMVVTVKPGFGMINGRFAYNRETTDLTLNPANNQYPRIDRVVLRCNYLNRLMELIVKQGTPAPTPEPPEVLQPTSGDYYELGLATIYISSNQTVITQSSITDTRPDDSVCGYVTQLIDHLDTSVFMAQLAAFYQEFVATCSEDYTDYTNQMDTFLSTLRNSGLTQLQEVVDAMTTFEQTSETEFNIWFEYIRGQLSDDVAGRLQNEIDAIVEKEFKHYNGLVNKVTEITGDGAGKTIAATGEGIVATTTFSTNALGAKVITTVVVPDEGVYQYTETVVIETIEGGKRITESYAQSPKE
jgi:hypothetical protein